MYDFYKVKGGKNYQEFKHPYFKQHNYKDLAFIKRKSVHKAHNTDIGGNADDQSEDNDNVQEKLEAISRSLEFVTAQNKELIEANRDIIARLYSFKNDYEARLKKLFFVFMVVIHNYDADLLAVLRQPLRQLNIGLEELTGDTGGQDMEQYIELLCKRIVSQDMDNQKLLDQLIKTFFAYFESKGTPITPNTFKWTGNTFNPHGDNLSVSLFNAETSEGFADSGSAFNRFYRSSKTDLPRLNPSRGFLFRDSTNQSFLQSPSKANEINFDDMHINEETGNMLLERRDEDSFMMSGANSVLMLSPFKRNL